MAVKKHINVNQVDISERTHPLQEVLDKYNENLTPELLHMRWHSIGYAPILLEVVIPATLPSGDTVYLMNFIRELSTGVELDDDTNLGETTSALYCPKSGAFLMIYNHEGIKENAMSDYFSRIADTLFQETSNRYEISPVFESDVIKKIEKSNKLTVIEFGVIIEQKPFDNDAATFAEASKNEDVRRERYTIFANEKYGRSKWWSFGKFKSEKIKAEKKGEIESAMVTYQELDGKSITVNLMQHRKKISFDANRLDIVKRAYTRDSKFDLLKAVYLDYRKSMSA